MSVNSFDPQQFDPLQATTELDEVLVAQALAAAHVQVDGAAPRLTAEEVATLAPAITHAG